MKKNKKNKNINLILFIILVLSIGIIGFSMARYQTSLTKQANASNANWNFKVFLNEEEMTNRENIYLLDLATTLGETIDTIEQGTIAPGAFGKFDIKLDFTGTQTGVKYTINFLTTDAFPEKLKFYTSEDYDNNNEIQMNVQQLDYIALDDINTIQTKTIYWKWNKIDEEAINDKEIQQSGKKVSIKLEIIAEQYIDEITKDFTDQKYFHITSDGKVSLNEEYKDEFSTTIQKLSIPQKVGDIEVISIEERAFAGNSLINSVDIPKGVKTIGESAFQNCENLKDVKIGKEVITIGKNAFYNCINLENVILNEKLERIESWAFDHCQSIKELILPQSVKYIGEAAFYNCLELQMIQLPENIDIINKWTFWNCTKLSNISIPNNVISIEEGAFGKCSSITNVQIGNKVIKIEDSAFYMNTSLESIVIPENVELIEQLAFANCKKLKQVTIQNSSIQVDETAFENCPI